MINRSSFQWLGPALAAFGAVGLAVLGQQTPGSRTLVSWWILERALSAENALPLIGFGVAIAPLGGGKAAIAASLFLLGTLLGFYYHRAFVEVMAFVPNAADHLFLAGPIALIAAGLLLISPTSVRGVFAVPAAVIIGAMLAQTISLTDPTINSWTISVIGVALGLWLIVTIALCVRSFYRHWFPIGARIVGSWLLAIGLLYGSAAFVVRPQLPLPDTNLMPPPPARALPDVNTNPSRPAPERLPTEP